MQYILGVDCGTEGVRAGIFNAVGSQIALITRTYSVNFLQNGWVEQDVNIVFSEVLEAIRELVSSKKIQSKDIIAIGIDATAVTLVASDANGRTLQDAILWMDKRAYKEAEEINKTDHSSLYFTGGSVSPEWALPKLMWLKRNSPDLYNESTYIVDLVDWLNFKLTGTWNASLCNLITEWTYVLNSGGWDINFLKELGINDLIAKVPREVKSMGEVISGLHKQIAQYVGLNPGIPVVTAGMDSYAAGVGLGVTAEDRMACSIGSSSCYLMLCFKPVQTKGLFGPMEGSIELNKWALQGGQTSASTIIKWYKDAFVSVHDIEEAKKDQLSIYSWLDNCVKDIMPGSNGLIALDCWQGNRTPLRDPLLTGAIWGLTLNHNKWHIYRALLESVAYGGRMIIESFESAGVYPKELYVCGGGSSSDLWLQIHADIIGIPIVRTEVKQSAALGAAICAATGAGIYKNLSEASKNMVQFERTFKPNGDNSRIYGFYYKLYKKSCEQLAGYMHELFKYKNRLKEDAE